MNDIPGRRVRAEWRMMSGVVSERIWWRIAQTVRIGPVVGQTDCQTFGQVFGETDGQTFGQAFGQTFGETDGQMFGQTFGQTLGHMFGQTFGQPLGRLTDDLRRPDAAYFPHRGDGMLLQPPYVSTTYCATTGQQRSQPAYHTATGPHYH